MEKMANKLDVDVSDSELGVTPRQGDLREDSERSSVTHSGKFASEKGSADLISLDGDEEFDGHDEQEKKSMASEHIQFA